VVYLIKWVFLALLIGSLAGALIWVMQSGVSALSDVSRAPYPYNCFFPILAGFIVGFVIHKIDPAASGEGGPVYIHSVQRRGGYLAPRTVLLYLVGAIVTLGLGGSGGFVGPACLICGGAGGFLFRKVRFLSRVLRFRKANLRLAMVCGAGAGIAAVLDAPIGGGIFAVEVLYAASIEYEGVFPAVLASITGYSVHSLMSGGFTSPYRHGALAFSPTLMPGLLLMAVVAGLLGILFVVTFKRVFDTFQKLSRWGGWRPVVGGLVCAAVAIALKGRTLGPSRDTFLEIVNPGIVVPVSLLALILAGKIVSNTFTVGSGNAAGLTLPVLIVGAAAGNIVASLLHASDPAHHIAFVATGMAGMLAAVLNVPIAAMIILMEMFGTSYAVPAVLGSIIAFSIARSEVVYRYLETEE
jgi:CIC family chloride channel protein